jgi:hypothetical protein
MNELQSRLAALRRRMRLVVVWRGLTVLLALILGCAILAGLVDWRLHLPSLIRALLLVGILAWAGYLVNRYLLKPLWGKTDDLSLALRVEEHYPILNDGLASTVQFLEQPAEAETTGSPALRREAVQRSLRLAQGCNFNDIVDSRGILWAGGGAVLCGIFALILFMFSPGLAWTGLWRLLEPFGDHSWTHLAIEQGGKQPQRVALGKPYVIKGKVTGIIPAYAKIDIENRNPDELDSTRRRSFTEAPSKALHELFFPTSGSGKMVVPIQNGNLEVPLDMTQQPSKFWFRVWANDAVYPGRGKWHEVEVVPPPQLALLDGQPSPQLELRYPAYTELKSPEKLPPGIGNIDAVAGTHVTLRAAVDRPIKEAWIEYQTRPPESVGIGIDHVKAALMLGPLGASTPLEALNLVVGGQTVWSRIPAKVAPDGKRLSVSFMPMLKSYVVLHIEDEEGLSGEYIWLAQIFADPIPTVSLERPSGNQDLLPDAEITLKILAADDRFAVRSVFLEYRKKDAEGKWLDDGPQRLPLYDHPAGEPKQQRVPVEKRWSLKGLAKDGETLVIQACADDFNDVAAYTIPGKSHEVELRIVSRGQLAKKLDEGLGQVQEELVRLQQMQDEALAKVKEIQDKIGKPGFRPNQELIEVEQKQQQIQSRIGASKEEGLRAEIQRLKQILRDNKLPPSDVNDLLKTLGLELDRIAQEDLQHIEPNQMEARKQLKEEPKAPKAPKEKGPLDKAKTHQENTKRALDDLVKFMDPWAGLNQVKSSARKIQGKQGELKKATEKLDEAQKNNMPREDLEKVFKKVMDSQNDLAGQMGALRETMRQAQQKHEQKGEPHIAKLLKDAMDAADQGLIQDKMRQAKNDLQNEKPNMAGEKQKEAMENLDKVIAALEERRDDQVDKLMRKQQKEEAKVDELRERQDILQKKVKKEKQALDELAKKQKEIEKNLANKKGDPEKLKAEQKEVEKQIAERKRELERLAEEQRKLREDVKEKARELARLQAEGASKELNRAAQEMDRAAQQLENGENPEDAQNEALERLENAQAKLQEAQDELLREQLAKIADKLKGLKERQDAAIAESVRLHKEAVERKKHWTDPLLQSLKMLAKSQKTIGLETDSLKEKLKGAKVFEHILKRTVKAMDEAASSLDKRFAKGSLRLLRLEAFDKEELADENKSQKKTLHLQQEARRKLTSLLDALKEEIARAKRPRKDKKDGGKGKEPEDGGGLRGPGDGIPPVAQLKALRDEQREINERTKDFAKRYPNWPKLDEGQMPRMAEIQNELSAIQAEQAAIQRLFEEITAAAGKKGENP